MAPRKHTLTREILESVVEAIRTGSTQRDAFEALGVPAVTGAAWLWAGGRDGDDSRLEAELARRVGVARAEARRSGARRSEHVPLVLGPMPADERRTGLDLLGARAPAAAASLTGPLDAPASAERAVQAAMAALELQADLVARQDEITSADLRDLLAALRTAGKLHEQLAAAEKHRAEARATATVEMFVVANVQIVSRHVTPDQLMRIRGDLMRLPAVAGVFSDDSIVDVTPEPAAGLITEEVPP